jgi:hypothetical protein
VLARIQLNIAATRKEISCAVLIGPKNHQGLCRSDLNFTVHFKPFFARIRSIRSKKSPSPNVFPHAECSEVHVPFNCRVHGPVNLALPEFTYFCPHKRAFPHNSFSLEQPLPCWCSKIKTTTLIFCWQKFGYSWLFIFLLLRTNCSDIYWIVSVSRWNWIFLLFL